MSDGGRFDGWLVDMAGMLGRKLTDGEVNRLRFLYALGREDGRAEGQAAARQVAAGEVRQIAHRVRQLANAIDGAK
jgi:hypothetical protein